MANKRKRTRQKHSVRYWRNFVLTVLLQIMLVVQIPFSLQSVWPANQVNTDTIVGEVERAEWVDMRKNRSYLRITVNGQEYRYKNINRKEISGQDIAKALEPGETVELSYKSILGLYNKVVALEDETQVFRDVQTYNASAKRRLPVLAVVFMILEFWLWSFWIAYKKPWYELTWFEKILKRVKKDHKKKRKKIKHAEMNEKL
ncbi:MAG: hypothetical protein J6S28_05695 [Clostridia bacterium]|nr:hypothetical protein [Clostridia bacterium]MBO7295968.1 hypothetical protein [Clostridia bacterium]